MAKPNPLPLPDRKPTPAEVEVAREALTQGQLVAFPTETVYGIAARADDPEALGRLRTLKERDPDRPLTWHVGRKADLDQLQLKAQGPVSRLVERYWPGPLTLVLPGSLEQLRLISSEGWIGTRLPAHAGTAGILSALPFPVVMSSANRSGEAPATELGPVLDEYGDALGAAFDGGPARLAEASTVLRLGHGRFELLREGLLSLEDLRRAAGLRLLFVCTGNTCRSPMAEGLAKAHLAAALDCPVDQLTHFGFEVRSMGVFGAQDSPASREAVQVLEELDIDIANHTASRLRVEVVDQADHVFCLTHSHRQALVLELPPGRTEHVELLDPEGKDIPDPIGAPLETYRVVRDRIEACIRARISAWV